MERIQQIETVKRIIMKYLVPKIEYDGMTAYELATIMLRELDGEKDAVNVEKDKLPQVSEKKNAAYGSSWTGGLAKVLSGADMESAEVALEEDRNEELKLD